MGKNPMMKPPADREPSRNGYGRGLVKVGRSDDDVVALDADLAGSTRSAWFEAEFPDRFFQMGISEQDMIGTACGLASSGKRPFASTFAIFTQRAWEQIRTSVARPNLDVKICGSHGGLITGQDGSSAQALEDLGIYRTLPNMVVVCPADARQAEAATLALYEREGPSYMRTERAPVDTIYDEDATFEIGSADRLRDGDDVAILACGPLVQESLEAAETLAEDGIGARVVNVATLKPIDREAILDAATDCGVVVTAEDHQITGGLGSAVAEVLAEAGAGAPLTRIGVQDTWCESGSPDALYEKYGLSARRVAETVRGAVEGA